MKFTERSIKGLTPKKLALEPGQRKTIMDDTITGFGVRVSHTGVRSFFVIYGPPEKRERYTIGKYGKVTLEDAKKAAIAILSKYSTKGIVTPPRSKRMKFGEYADLWLENVKLTKKHPQHDCRYLAMVKEQWGSSLLEDLTRDQVLAAMRDVVNGVKARLAKQIETLEQHLTAAEKAGDPTVEIKDRVERARARKNIGHTEANRFLASIRACLNSALAAGHIQANPAAGIKGFLVDPPRARVLTDKEMKRFLDAIAQEEDPHVRAAFRLMIETGARRSEVLRAEWEDFNLDALTWRIPSPKSGHPQIVPISRQTVALLRHTPRVGRWLVPSPKKEDSHRHDLAKPWKRIVKKAKLDGVHIHDIRRTFGLDVARSAGLHVASKLLRHSDVRVTERVYAPLGLDDLRDAVEAVQRPAPDNVVDIKAAGGEK